MSTVPTLPDGTATAPRGRFDWEVAGDAQKGGYSDLFNARRFAERHGVAIRYCYPWKSWLHFDGTRWTKDESGEIERRAKETVENLYAEAEKLTDLEDRKRLRAHALRSESAARINSMILLARSEPGIPIAVEDFDKNPWLLNVANGTLDLHTGTLRTHRLDDFITKLAPVEFDETAACPVFEKFLQRITDGNERLAGFLQKAIGYSLTGITREHVLFIPYGTGRNGKSTFCTAVEDVMGDYAMSTPPDTLMVRFGDAGTSNDVARLRGARFVSAIEAEDGRRLAESKLKQLTGGDRVSARFLFAEFFDFHPEFKLWLATNHKPEIRGTDEAIWRRVRLVPFDVTIPEEEADRDLSEKLRRELPGILSWAVAGCLLWQHKGLAPPEEVRTATQEYRREQDFVQSFISARCVVGEKRQIAAGRLYGTFKAWCEGQGEKPRSSNWLGRRLTEKGFRKTDDRTPLRIGIGLPEEDGAP